jgi:hypothetical protein
MRLSMPITIAQAYPKLSRSFFSLICIILTDFVEHLPEIGVEVYMLIMESLDKAVVSSDTYVQSEACASIDNISTYIIENSSKRTASTSPIIAFFSKYPVVFETLLSTVIGLLLTEEENQWSISRALLPLILLNSAVHCPLLNISTNN